MYEQQFAVETGMSDCFYTVINTEIVCRMAIYRILNTGA